MLNNDQVVETLLNGLERQDRVLEDIRKQVLKTNGRVNQIEQARAIEEAVTKASRESIAANLEHRQRLTGWALGLVIAACGSAFGSFAYLIFH